MEENMIIIYCKYKDNDFAINAMMQMSKIFSWSCENKDSWKGDIRTDIKKSAKMLISMVDNPDISKDIHINSHSLVCLKDVLWDHTPS